MSKTKIIATIGPASRNQSMLRKMVARGLDVVRLNFSHGTWVTHQACVDGIRKINAKYRRAIKVMQDLEGFRIRLGKLKTPLTLKKRQVLYFTQEEIIGENRRIPFDYRGSLEKISKGIHLYVDDGKIVLRVKAVGTNYLKLEVVVGGLLTERKGINIPDVSLDFASLTAKDIKDVQFAVKNKVDFIAQSFVRSDKDIASLQELMRPYHPRCKIFAKVESQEALKNIDAIIRRADGIIVARGDLGICVPIYTMPLIQKELIKKCRRAGKPVVVATQMLDSMTHEVIPTRAEVTDVANAILDGTDYVLVSQETAVGEYPDKVVEMMDKIIRHTEAYIKAKKVSRVL